MNENNQIKIGNVLIGLGIVLGCVVYTYAKRKTKREVIDISSDQPQEPMVESRD